MIKYVQILPTRPHFLNKFFYYLLTVGKNVHEVGIPLNSMSVIFAITERP